MKWLWKIGAILACVVLVACGADDSDSDGDDSANASPTVAASPTAEPATISIGDIVWSESTDEETGEPVDIVEGFMPQSPAIIASIEVADMPAGTEFSATWTLNDQPIEASEMHVQAEGDVEQGWVAFRFTREQGTYPIGQLGVTITSSDGDMREDSIEIAFP